MSALGAMTLEARGVDRWNNRDILVFTMPVANPNPTIWTRMTVTIPEDIREAMIIDIVGQSAMDTKSFNAPSDHGVGEPQRMRGAISRLDNGQPTRVHISEDVGQVPILFDTNDYNYNEAPATARWREINEHVFAGQTFEVWMWCMATGGAADGDYTLILTLDVRGYNKQ